MTKSQLKAIENIKKLAEKLHSFSPESYEIKRFEVEEISKLTVSVYVVVGMKDDEGTMAEVFCRDIAHLFVGKNGGIKYPVSKKLKNGNYKHYYKRFGGYSLLQAVVDQR